jgi:hypothetical protein
MKKLKLIIAIVLVGALVLTKASTTYAYVDHETVRVSAGEREKETIPLDEGWKDVWKITTIDLTRFDFSDLDSVQMSSLGTVYDDFFRRSFNGEYWDLIYGVTIDEEYVLNYDISIEYGAQEREYSVLRYDDQLVYALDLQTGEFYTYYALDQGFEWIDVTFVGQLGDYNSGVIDGEENKTPTGIWEYNANDDLFIFLNDGTRFEIGEGPYLYAYNDAFDEGYVEGINSTSFGFGWITAFFGMFGAIFSIELLPGLSIGLIVGVPIAFSLTLGIIKVIRG